MRSVRRLGFVAALICPLALACVGGSAVAAGAGARTAKVRTVYLKRGDQLRVKGARLACVVQRSSGALNFVCVKGTLSAPAPGAYGVGIADNGADLAAVSNKSAKLVKAVAEPAVSGALFPVPAGKARSYTVAPSTAVLIGGTHIFCAVDTSGGAINVTCGITTLAAKLQYEDDTFITSISPKFAVIAKKGAHGKVATVALKAQP